MLSRRITFRHAHHYSPSRYPCLRSSNPHLVASAATNMPLPPRNRLGCDLAGLDLHARSWSQIGATNMVLARDHEACTGRSEEHTSELQSLMRISYAVFCLKKK